MLRRISIAQVRLKTLNLDAVPHAQRLRNLLEPIDAPRDQHQIHIKGCELTRELGADSGRCTGNQRTAFFGHADPASGHRDNHAAAPCYPRADDPADRRIARSESQASASCRSQLSFFR